MTELVHGGATSVVPAPIHYALDSKAAGRVALQRVAERFPSGRFGFIRPTIPIPFGRIIGQVSPKSIHPSSHADLTEAR